MSGIFRDIYLFSTPSVHIRDVRIVAELDDAYQDAALTVQAWLKNYTAVASANHSLTVHLMDDEGETIFPNLWVPCQV